MNRELLNYYKPSFKITYIPKYTNEEIKETSAQGACKQEAKMNFYLTDEYYNCKEIINIVKE